MTWAFQVKPSYEGKKKKETSITVMAYENTSLARVAAPLPPLSIISGAVHGQGRADAMAMKSGESVKNNKS